MESWLSDSSDSRLLRPLRDEKLPLSVLLATSSVTRLCLVQENAREVLLLWQSKQLGRALFGLDDEHLDN
jgi:hypothetical protein